MKIKKTKKGKMKMKKYKGREIRRTTYLASKRWYVPTYHKTGIQWDEQLCPQFYTLSQAREWIDARG